MPSGRVAGSKNRDRGWKPPGGEVARDPGLVRCLGMDPEHWWRSPDQTNLRVCPRCQPYIDGLFRIPILAGLVRL